MYKQCEMYYEIKETTKYVENTPERDEIVKAAAMDYLQRRAYEDDLIDIYDIIRTRLQDDYGYDWQIIEDD